MPARKIRPAMLSSAASPTSKAAHGDSPFPPGLPPAAPCWSCWMRAAILSRRMIFTADGRPGVEGAREGAMGIVRDGTRPAATRRRGRRLFQKTIGQAGGGRANHVIRATIAQLVHDA